MCRACGVARYCNAQCQKADWSVHKEPCNAYRANSVVQNDEVIRELVLSRRFGCAYSLYHHHMLTKYGDGVVHVELAEDRLGKMTFRYVTGAGIRELDRKLDLSMGGDGSLECVSAAVLGVEQLVTQMKASGTQGFLKGLFVLVVVRSTGEAGVFVMMNWLSPKHAALSLYRVPDVFEFDYATLGKAMEDAKVIGDEFYRHCKQQAAATARQGKPAYASWCPPYALQVSLRRNPDQRNFTGGSQGFTGPKKMPMHSEEKDE
jgi:hypothetical protein